MVARLKQTNWQPGQKAEFAIIGSSLGGFYALNLALKHLVPTILINPALVQVAEGLKTYLGIQTNYKTQEVYNWTEADLEALRQLELKSADWVRLKGHLRAYLDEGDQVLPAQAHAELLKSHGIYTQLYPAGNHLFEHLPELVTDLSDWLS